MTAPDARLWLAERVAELLPGIEVLGYGRLAAPDQHELLLRDPPTRATVVLRLPHAWIESYQRGQRERLESVLLAAGQQLTEAAGSGQP